MTDSTVKIDWTDNSQNETGFSIYIAQTTPGSTTISLDANLGAETNFLSPLANDTMYSIDLAAVNNAGSSSPSSVTFSTLPDSSRTLAAPTGISTPAAISYQGGYQATVTFTNNAIANNPDGYVWYLASDPSQVYSCNSATKTECVMRTFNLGSTYTVKIAAYAISQKFLVSGRVLVKVSANASNDITITPPS